MAHLHGYYNTNVAPQGMESMLVNVKGRNLKGEKNWNICGMKSGPISLVVRLYPLLHYCKSIHSSGESLATTTDDHEISCGFFRG